MYPSIHVSMYPSIHDIQVSIYPSIWIHKKLRYPTIHVSKHWIVRILGLFSFMIQLNYGRTIPKKRSLASRLDCTTVAEIFFFCPIITVAGRGKISEPSTAGTSNLDWRCFEYFKIDRNEFHIRQNFRKIKKK
jgi:hypothetical protein